MEGIERNKNFQTDNILKYSPDFPLAQSWEEILSSLCNLCAIEYRAIVPLIMWKLNPSKSTTDKLLKLHWKNTTVQKRNSKDE